MRTALVCALLAAAAQAQVISSIYVSAPQVRVTSGDSIQLSAVARDGAGNPVQATFQWSSNNSGVAQVDSGGMATASALGFADISASAGGRAGVIRLQVLPQRIQVSPADLSINFGSQQQFSAVAFDSQNQPILNASFTWHVMVGGGTQDSTTVPISPAGLVTARTLGYYLVRATVLYPATADQFQREFDGSASLRIVPADYKLSPLVSSSLGYPSFRIRGRRSTITANGSGQIAFTASLDGITGALMTWQNSSVNVLATAGSPGVMPGTVYYDFDNASIDSQGNVVATATMTASGSTVVLANSGGVQLLVPDRAAADQVLDVTGISTNRFSLSENGDVVLRGNFHYDGSAVNYNGILRYSGGLILEASSRDPLPGLTGAVSFDGNYGIDAKGAIYFAASAGTGRAIYRKELFKDPVQVIALGDKLNGITVTQLPGFINGSGGDLIVQAGLADGSQVLARYAGGFDGRAPAVMSSAPGYINQLWAANATGGVVWLGDAGPGFGVYLWSPGSTASQPVLQRYAPTPTGEPAIDFYSAAVDTAGNVYLSLRCVDTPWMLLRATGTPVVIAASGTPVSVYATVDLNQQTILGDRTGPLHVWAGGNFPSIFQVDARGLLPALLVGDRLPGGSTYFGNFNTRKSPSGDLYVTTDNGAFRISSSGQSQIVGFPYLFSDGVNLFAPFNLAVNDHGQLVAIGGTDRSHQRLALFDGNTLRTIAYFGAGPPFQTASPAGGAFLGLNDMAINDSGQVMINATVSGGPGGLFFFDGNAWQGVCQLQVCKLDGETITGLGPLRVSNNKFCAALTTSATNTRLDCWESGTWNNVLRRGDFTSDGTEITFVQNSFDINRRGDVAAILNTSLGAPNVFLKTADGFKTVFASLFPPDASFLQGIYSVDLRDDRRVFFITQDYTGRMVAYAADPQF